MATNKNANKGSLPGLVKSLTNKISKDMEHSLPCIVTAVESRTRVSVKPLIKVVDNDGNMTSRKEVFSVPVVNFGAGDLLMSFPVAVGDLGWIDASDRDISTFLQGYLDSAPPTRRKHSFSDARFVPDIMHNFTVSEDDDTALVIQNRTGTVKIAMDDEIRITNDTVSVVIDGSKVTGTAPGGFFLNNVEIDATGNIITPASVTAAVTVTANTVAATTSLTVADVEQSEHTHAVTGIQTGSGTVESNPPTEL